MLSYEEFKEKLVTEVTVYAPEKYKNAIVDIMGVPKAEGNVDAIIMRMPDRNSGASLKSNLNHTKCMFCQMIQKQTAQQQSSIRDYWRNWHQTCRAIFSSYQAVSMKHY